MTVHVNGKPLKRDYRKFRIKSVAGPNDYACMREVLSRRFRHGLEEQREIDGFRQRYATTGSKDDLNAMREIDRQVLKRATVYAVLIGLAGTLVLGAGLSMVLSFHWMAPGIIVGCAGIGVMASMPALYGVLLRRGREKAAPIIQKMLDKAGR